MADIHGFGEMNLGDRGGKHDFAYDDASRVAPSDGPTPSQTVGPFFAYGLTPGSYGYPYKDIHSADLTVEGSSTSTIVIEGQIFDGAGNPIHDAMVELVQADETGRYVSEPRNDGFTGYGRCGTGSNGPAEKGGDTRFQFTTVKPGASGKGSAPFVTLIVTMRGLLNHCITRVYFPDDDHGSDPVLEQVPAERRATLVALETAPNRFQFNIHMQGENETVFFDL